MGEAALGIYASQCVMPSLHPWLAFFPDNALASPASEGWASPLPAQWLFAASKEPVVIVDAVSGTIIHANPAAALLVRMGGSELMGMKFVSLFDSPSASKLLTALAEAESVGQSNTLILRTPFGMDLAAGLSWVRVPPESFVLVRFSEHAPLNSAASTSYPTSAVFDAIDAAPMAFLVTDSVFKVEYANRAFSKMAGAEAQGEILGNSLLRWLLLTALDIERLSERLSQRQAAELVATVMRPNQGNPRQVEVCAVPVPDGIHTRWGFTVRMLPRLN
jgi:PAS domain-containing protein